jgi:hypothetical protein
VHEGGLAVQTDIKAKVKFWAWVVISIALAMGVIDVFFPLFPPNFPWVIPNALALVMLAFLLIDAVVVYRALRKEGKRKDDKDFRRVDENIKQFVILILLFVLRVLERVSVI